MMDSMMRNCFTHIRRVAPRWTTATLLALATFAVAAMPILTFAAI